LFETIKSFDCTYVSSMYVKSVFFAFIVKHVASMSALQQTNTVT